jgi:phosphate transport system protein
MATGHTVKAFDEDLGQLRALISEMGGRAEAAITGSLEALANRDLESAAKIVEADKKIDELEAEVERQVVRLIALRAPMADDLREVLAALKIAGLVERMGDYAKNIAKRIALLQEARGMDAMAVLPAMGKIAAEMVRNILDAFVLRDAEAALAVAARDKAVDDFYNSLFRTLLTYMMENPHNITASTHLLFIAKNIERIGDHATNVAEMVYFAATGRQMAERAKGEDPLLGADA